MKDKIWRFILKLFEDELTYFASSLSFYTIFSIVPLMMIGFSIATSLPSFEQYYGQIEQFLLQNVIPVKNEQIGVYIDMFLENSSTMGVFGLIYALFATAMFFDNYEYVVAKIFKVRKKSIWNMLSTYWTFMTLMPIALGVSFYLSAAFGDYTGFDLSFVLPYLIVWATFFVAYKISTSETILYKAVFISSFVSSLVWYIGKSVYIYYVMYNKAYTSLYGSFSMVLFFFLWLYVSWIIYLYGLKMCAILHEKYSKKESENAPE
ncbi:MAG: YihY/virulence factor BrkB family protein [Campylobacterota bacterium]